MALQLVVKERMNLEKRGIASVSSSMTATVVTTPPKMVLSTSNIIPADSATRKRRPLIISQESAEASPAPNVELDRPSHPRLTTLLSDNASGENASTGSAEESREEGKLNEFVPRRLSSWLSDILEVPTEKAQEFYNVETEDEEEGIIRIIRSTLKLERLLWYGVGLCLDQVLSNLTILPLRIAFRVTHDRDTLRSPHMVFDIACFSILILAVLFLAHFVGAAQVYHSIRLQTFMKLYVVVNIAEVLDRLLSSLGLDLFELLAETSVTGSNWVSFGTRYLLCLAYTCAHATLFYVRLLTLSVAVNSSNDALFTILVSNNFVELKGSVFKRSTEQNLFQISCSDIVERFVLIVFMFLVGLNEYETIKGDASRAEFIGLMCLVLLVELIVDWIKHMFIVRFNSDIRIKDVYDRFLGILADDSRGRSTVVDETRMRNVFPAVPKRLGLPIMPVTVIIVRVVVFDVSDVFCERSWLLIAGCWLSCLVGKLALKQVYHHWTLAIATEIAAQSDDEDKSPAVTPAAASDTPVTPIKLTLVTSTAPSPLSNKTPGGVPTIVTPATVDSARKGIVERASSKNSTSKSGKTPAKVLSKVNRFENG